MTQAKQVSLAWDELFDRVWNAPLWKVAKDIGISNLHLHKACVRLGIPLPTRGHWQKPASKRPSKPKLKTLGALSSRVTFEVTEKDDSAETRRLRPDPKPEIQVPETLTKPHPMVAAFLKAAKRARIDRGRLVLDFKEHLKIKVTPDCLDRACRIMDALMKGTEHAGYSWSVAPSGDTTIICNGESMRFQLVERVAKRGSPETLEPRRHSRYSQRTDHAAMPGYIWASTNELAITINEFTDVPVRMNWRDTMAATLESKLSDMVAQLPLIAEALKDKREKWEAWQQEREHTKQLQEEAKRQAEGLRLLRQRLVANMTRWEESKRIRQFCDAVESDPPAFDGPEQAAWLAWAREQADLLDPLKSQQSELLSLDVKVPDWFKSLSDYERPETDWWSVPPRK